MAALTFPLTAAQFMDLLRIESIAFNLRRFETLSLSGGGEWLTSKLAPDLWEAECTTTVMTHREAATVQALIAAIGSVNTVMVYHPGLQYPVDDLDLDHIVGGGVAISQIASDRVRMKLNGLPTNYTITAGDLIQITYGTSRIALFQVVVGASTGGGAETGYLEVRPVIESGIAVADEANLYQPAFKGKIVPGSDRVETVGPVLSRIVFTVRQTLAN